jgi:3-hydroxymyristoyl/3-hydroxydecanoyl-(acyl carrier protein) dehydratase
MNPDITSIIPTETINAGWTIAVQAKWFFAGYFAAMPFMVTALALRIFRKLGSTSPDL